MIRIEISWQIAKLEKASRSAVLMEFWHLLTFANGD
jgi:hypothetical protein